MINLARLSPTELLQLHARVGDELRARGIIRSANNPTGDLAEHLFCKAFGWKQSGNSNANIDAISKDGTSYQIKGRRLHSRSKSRQLGAIRDFDGKHFKYLAGVLFAEDYSVFRAAIIPYGVVEERATYVKHTNSHKFILHDDVWTASGVRDVTKKLRAVRL
jgi:hypothetical protein